MQIEAKLKADKYFDDQCKRMSIQAPERVELIRDPYTAFMRVHHLSHIGFVKLIDLGGAPAAVKRWCAGSKINGRTLERVAQVMGIEDPQRLITHSEWPALIEEIQCGVPAVAIDASLEVVGPDRVKVRVDGVYPRNVALAILKLAQSNTKSV